MVSLSPPTREVHPAHTYTSRLCPFRTAAIEHPVAGGGIYITPPSYARILSTLLLPPSSSYPHPLSLSSTSLSSLFTPTLPTSLLPSLSPISQLLRPGIPPLSANWSTGLCLWNRRKVDPVTGKEWGALEGLAGWGGAGNTSFGVDRKAGVAWVWSTNCLPPGEKRAVAAMAECERVLYEGLGY